MTWSQTARNPDIFLSNCILKHRQITRINRPARGRPALRIGIVPSTGRSRCKGEKGQLSEDVLQQLRSLLSLASLKNGWCFFFWDLSCGLVGLWDLPFDWDIWARKLFTSRKSHGCFTCESFNVARRYLFAKISFWLPYCFFKDSEPKREVLGGLTWFSVFFQSQPPSTVWLIFLRLASARSLIRSRSAHALRVCLRQPSMAYNWCFCAVVAAAAAALE